MEGGVQMDGHEFLDRLVQGDDPNPWGFVDDVDLPEDEQKRIRRLALSVTYSNITIDDAHVRVDMG